jgi:hypothetical protein
LMQHAATFADALAREIGDTDRDLGADGHMKVEPGASTTSGRDIEGARAAFNDTLAGQDAAVGADAETGGSFDQDDKEDLILCGSVAIPSRSAQTPSQPGSPNTSFPTFFVTFCVPTPHSAQVHEPASWVHDAGSSSLHVYLLAASWRLASLFGEQLPAGPPSAAAFAPSARAPAPALPHPHPDVPRLLMTGAALERVRYVPEQVWGAYGGGSCSCDHHNPGASGRPRHGVRASRARPCTTCAGRRPSRTGHAGHL